MELRQLVYFRAVARRGGFTRAAEHLHVAQSAISAQVRALEHELGVELLRRSTRRVVLTKAGELLLGRADQVLGQLDAVRDELSELSGVLRGRVVLGATAVVGPLDVPAALGTFHERHPQVGLALRSGLVADLLADLDRGEVDLVLGPLHEDLPSRFAAVALFDEDVVLVAPPDHRLAHRRQLGLDEVAGEGFVCLPGGSGLRRIHDEAFAAAGVEPSVRFETHGPASVRELVAHGLGLALLARSCATAPGPRVAVLDVRPAVAHPRIGLLHHRDHRLSAVAQACRRHLLRCAAATG